jgi:hypothetical protein
MMRLIYCCVFRSPGNNKEHGSILDVCGDYSQGEEFERPEGYIDSLNYPYVYSPNTMCSCNLTTTSPGATIALHVLDLDIQQQDTNGDWLEYARDLGRWGRGTLLQRDDIGREIQTGLSSVMINFNSNDRIAKRGFWLKYKGVGAGNEEADVKILCGQVTPPRKYIQYQIQTCIRSPYIVVGLSH